MSPELIHIGHVQDPSGWSDFSGGFDHEYHVRQLMLALGLTSDAGESSNHLISYRR